MNLSARPLIGHHGELTLWVGVFDLIDPPLPTFRIGGAVIPTVGVARFYPIPDKRTASDGSGKPLNHQGIFRLPVADSTERYQVTVTCGGHTIVQPLSVPSLPRQVPNGPDAKFTIMLASCYCMDTDRGWLWESIGGLPTKPDITILAGDQGYLDLPFHVPFPGTEPEMSQVIGDAYQKVWLPRGPTTHGIHPLALAAPTACTCDDHEFWNGYPHLQYQLLKTQNPTTREMWANAATGMYRAFQHGGDPTQSHSARVIDIDPLSILIVDTRSERLEDFNDRFGLISQETEKKIHLWADQLIARNTPESPAIGILVTGQSFLSEATLKSRLFDAEYPDYATQYAVLLNILDRLAFAKVPIVCLTGDVHWNRVTPIFHHPTERNAVHEVICSPTSWYDRNPAREAANAAANAANRLVGVRDDPWRMHPDFENPPAKILNHNFAPGLDKAWWTDGFEGCRGYKGEMVALLGFSKKGRSVEMTVTYHPIHKESVHRTPIKARTITLSSV